MNNRNILSLAGNLTMATLQVFSQVLLYWTVSASILGNWVLFLAAANIVEALRSGITQAGLIRFHAGAGEEEAKKVIGAAWFISFMMTALFIVVNIPLYFLSGLIHDSGWKLFFQYFSITVLCSLPYNFATWLLQSEQRFDKIIYLRIIALGSFLVFIGIAYYLHFNDLNGIFLCYSASMLLASMYAVLARFTKMKALFGTDRHFVSKLFNFGKFSMGTGVSAILLSRSDTLIINAFLGPVATAVYNIPQKIMEVMAIPVNSFVGTAFPTMSVQATENRQSDVAATMEKYAGALTVSILPLILFIFLFSGVIVSLFGKHYAESGVVLKIFMVYAALLPIDRFLGLTLDIMNRPHLNFLKTLVMLAVNVAGDIAGIFIFHNIISVAAASVLTFLAGIIFGHLALRRYLNYRLWDIMITGYAESLILAKSMLRKVGIGKSATG